PRLRARCRARPSPGPGAHHGAGPRRQRRVLQQNHGAAGERASRLRAGEAPGIRAGRGHLQARLGDARRWHRRGLGAAKRAGPSSRVRAEQAARIPGSPQSRFAGGRAGARWVGYLVRARGFLTGGPVPGREAGEAGAPGRAAWGSPPVGVAGGGCLAAADRSLLALAPPLLGAVLLVAAWKIVTGGL